MRILDYFKRYVRAFSAGIVFLIVTQAFALAIPRLLRLATDALVAGDAAQVRRAAMWIIGVAILGSIARIFSRTLIFNSGRRVECDMRNDLFVHIEKLEPSFYRTISPGQLMSRMVNDLTQVRLLLGPGILNVTNTCLVYAVVVPLLFITDASLALYALLPTPLLLLLGRTFGKRLYEHTLVAQERLGALSSKVQENLGGVMTVRAYRREAAEEQQFARLNDAYVEVNVTLAKLRGLMVPMMGLAGAAGTIIVLYAGGLRIGRGEMTVGAFVEFNAYLAALTWPTIALGWMISLWQRGLAALERINQIFLATPRIVDGPVQPHPSRGDLRIEHLTFAYEEGAEPALSDLSCEFRSGETVVIVGRTGSGKTTILRALARLIEIPPKAVFLDGVDVVDLPLAHVRGTMAYAPQDAFLFSRTIRENIAFGVPQISEKEIASAIEAAHLTTDLESFPGGAETLVGERGITLSGGQRQRTALARALALDAKILLLDDTLAAVDSKTESHILARLARDRGRRTTIIVTHRLACAAIADRVLVLDRGRLVEAGTESELLALHGEYARMHHRQRLRVRVESVA